MKILTKTKEVTVFFSLKPEIVRKTPAVTIFYSVLILLLCSLITSGNFDTSL